MPTLFSDSFTRADSNSLGANWDDNADSIWQVATNQLRCNSASGFHILTSTTGHAAVADCKATVKRVTGTSFDGGPCVRGSGAQNSAAGTEYYLDVVAGASAHSVWRRNAGTDTDLGTRAFTVAAGDTYTLEASGTGATVTLKVYKNGVQQGANYSDANASRITAAGQTGVVIWGPNPCDLDDFLAEDLAAASGFPPPALVARRWEVPTDPMFAE